MKLENLIAVYKISTHNTTVAKIKEVEPEIESLPVEQAVAKVKQIVKANEMQVLERDRIEAELEKASKCRICNKSGRLITLMRNRPVFFCDDHNICNPIPVECIKQAGFDYETTK